MEVKQFILLHENFVFYFKKDVTCQTKPTITRNRPVSTNECFIFSSIPLSIKKLIGLENPGETTFFHKQKYLGGCF